MWFVGGYAGTGLLGYAGTNPAGSGGGSTSSPVPQDTTKQPEAVSANPFSVSKVLGRSIPIVIGTGKVDGIPVIGGAVTSQVVSGYTTQDIGIFGDLDHFPPGTRWQGDRFSGVVEIPTYATQQSAMLGYLLAYDPFGAGYELIRLEINDEVVYDAENGIGASEQFRFYGGTQTAVDPITTSNIGANAGAWQAFAIIYLSGFAADSAPSVKAVISNAATDTPAGGAIAWTGTAPSGVLDAFPHGSSYDPAENVIYQILQPTDIPGLTHIYLAVLEVDTRQERYRVPLEGSEPYAVGRGVIDYQLSVPITMRGTSLVMIQLSGAPATPRLTGIWDVATGKLIASHVDTVNMVWLTALPIGQKWVFFGESFDDNPNCMAAVFDPATASIDVSNILPSGPNTYVAVRGRVTSGFTSFFSATASLSGNVDLYELRFDGDAWTAILIASLTGITDLSVNVLWFDPLTNYLVVNYRLAGPTNRFKYINPDTGAIVDTFDANSSKIYSNVAALVPTFHDRLVSKPGFVLMLQTAGSNEIISLNIQAKTLSTFATGITAPDGTRLSYLIADQGKALWISALGAYVWTVHKLPGTIPGLVDLSDIVTKVMFLGGYGPSELTFEGFTGLSGFGFVIASDTNTRTVLQSIADIYGFSFADTGSGFYFKKPGRDDAFALDAALTTADLVFGDKSAVDSTDEATIRTTARVELDYISKEQGYTQRPASFQMPPINNSNRTDKYSTALVLSDQDAKTFCIEKYFELQARRRDHTFSLTGKPTFLPGDVVSVPSGAITFNVLIDSVALNRNMVADIQASDFQTSVSTTVTPVTNTGFGNIVPVTLQTQYIHLDIPLFRYADDLGGLGLRQYGVVASRGQAGWGGGALYRGDTSALLTALLSQAPHNGVIGICSNALDGPVDPFATTDISTVTFRKTAGSATLLVNKTEDQVLAGANFAFIGAAGRWEGVGYKTVVDNGDGTFTLSGFTVRGYRGTEVFAYDHQVGDLFVMIDPNWLKSVSHPLTDLDATKYYKALGLSQNPATGTVYPHTIRGAAETPYACINLSAVLGTPDGIDLTWDYRSRLATGTNPVNFGEATLSFEIDILATDGVTVKRTLTAITNSKHYAHADVVTDFGSDPPTELFFNVYMMSAVVGRGYRAHHHVYFTGFGSPIGLLLALTKG